MTVEHHEIVTPYERQLLVFLVGTNLAAYFALKIAEARPGKELAAIYPYLSLTMVVQTAYHGFAALCDGSMIDLLSSAERRLHGTNSDFDDLVQVTFSYEVWNALTTMLVPDLRSVESLEHHAMAAIVAKAMQQHGPAFYGLFFFGVASLSTFFLMFVMIFRHEPELLANRYPKAKPASRAAFSLSFLVLRAVAWPLMSLGCCYDFFNGLSDKRDMTTSYLVGLLIAILSFTYLQVSWAGPIWKELSKELSGSRKGDESEKKPE